MPKSQAFAPRLDLVQQHNIPNGMACRTAVTVLRLFISGGKL
jgi:hypothetical protein